MKKLFLLFIMISPLAWGQQIDYNKIILPKSAQNIDLGERLVQIAWDNNPENKAVAAEKEVARQNVKIARWAFLDNIYGVYNINEYTYQKRNEIVTIRTNNPNFPETVTGELVDGGVAAGNPFFPKYNFGIRLSLGDLVRYPLQTKRAKNHLSVADNNLNSRKLEIRAQVLEFYQNYIMYKELLKIQAEVTEDAGAAFSLAEKKFKDGDLTFEEYNEALQKFNNERVQRLTSENSYQIAKVRLERVVGVRMEDIE